MGRDRFRLVVGFALTSCLVFFYVVMYLPVGLLHPLVIRGAGFGHRPSTTWPEAQLEHRCGPTSPGASGSVASGVGGGAGTTSWDAPPETAEALAITSGLVHGSTAPSGRVHGSVSPNGRVHGSASPNGRVHNSVAPNGRVHGSTAPSGRVHGSVAPNGRVHGSAAPNGRVHGSASPNGRVHNSAAPNGRVHGSTAPSGRVHGSVAPNGRVHGSAAPNGRVHNSADPNGQVHNSADPNGRIHVKAAPSGWIQTSGDRPTVSIATAASSRASTNVIPTITTSNVLSRTAVNTKPPSASPTDLVITSSHLPLPLMTLPPHSSAAKSSASTSTSTLSVTPKTLRPLKRTPSRSVAIRPLLPVRPTVARAASLAESSTAHRPVTTTCPPPPLLTVNSGGRLGNKLCQYFTLWTLHRDTFSNITAWIAPAMATYFSRLFSGRRSLDVLPVKCRPAGRLAVGLGDVSTSLAAGKAVCVGGGSCNIAHFARHRRRLLAEFPWRAATAEVAAARLTAAAALLACPPAACSFIGVHVRRTDYAEWLHKRIDGHPVGTEYLQCALSLCRRRYRRAVFIVASDDPAWCRANILGHDVVHAVDVGAVPAHLDAAAVDMATLGLCNHTVVSYGTFSYMAAFRAGGHVIAPTGYSGNEHFMADGLARSGLPMTLLHYRTCDKVPLQQRTPSTPLSPFIPCDGW